MILEKSNNQSLFHFLLSELLVECTENIKNHSETTDHKLKEIGRQLGFKIYNQISLKRGISERPTNILEIFKNIKTKVFKHLFNYELSAEINSYKIQGKKAVVYGLVDETPIYLAWMPENCQLTVGSMMCGLMEAVCRKSDLQCMVTCQKVVGER